MENEKQFSFIRNKEIADNYMQCLKPYVAEYQLMDSLKLEIPPILCFDDSLFPTVAYGDSLESGWTNASVNFHGYVLIVITNLTAIEKRKQKRFARTGFNLLYCPIKALVNEKYGMITDRIIMKNAIGSPIVLANQTLKSGLIQLGMDQFKKLTEQGHIAYVSINPKLFEWIQLKTFVANKMEDVDFIENKVYSPKLCHYCEHIKYTKLSASVNFKN